MANITSIPFTQMRSDIRWSQENGVLQCWDCETLLFEVNAANPTQDQMLAAYRAGRERGEREGRIGLQYDIQRVLGIDGGAP